MDKMYSSLGVQMNRSIAFDTWSGASMQCQCPTPSKIVIDDKEPILRWIASHPDKGAAVSSSPAIIRVGQLIFQYSGCFDVAITLHNEI